MSLKEKEVFAKMFQNFDRLFAQMKSFTNYADGMLAGYGITQEEYDDYAGHYVNVLEEIKESRLDKETDGTESVQIDSDYELIQNIATPGDGEGDITPEERQKKIGEIRRYVEELHRDNPKIADIMSGLIDEIEADAEEYKGKSILNIVENMKQDCIDRVITDFCLTWYASKDDVMYAVNHYRNGEIPNESRIKATIDFTSYKAEKEKALPKFKYYAQMMSELKKTLDEEIKPLTFR